MKIINSTSGSNSSSTAETVSKIQSLLGKLQQQQQQQQKTTEQDKEDAASFDELRRILVQCVTSQELVWCGGTNSISTTEDPLAVQLTHAKQKYNSWLQRHYSIYVEQLCDRINQGKKYALRCLCGLLFSPFSMPQQSTKNTATANTSYRNHIYSVWVKAVEALCDKETTLITSSATNNNNNTHIIKQDALIHMFLQEFVTPHPDIVYMTFSSIKKLAFQQLKQNDTQRQQYIIENMISILQQLPIITDASELQKDSNFIFTPFLTDPLDEDDEVKGEEEEEEEDNETSDDEDNYNEDDNKEESTKELQKKKKKHKTKQPEKSLSRHKRIVEETWLAVLQLDRWIPIKCHKRMLPYLSQRIVPYVHHPLRFAEYFTNCYTTESTTTSSTTIVPCLALHGLFHLITQYEFEHANFYQCLYQLVQPAIFYAKFRTRFFTLLIQTLSSQPKLPAYVVAAFLKRLCRCAVTSPPSGALFVLALSSNLLRQHKACACLLHRSTTAITALQDPFDALTNDPLQSRGTYYYVRGGGYG